MAHQRLSHAPTTMHGHRRRHVGGSCRSRCGAAASNDGGKGGRVDAPSSVNGKRRDDRDVLGNVFGRNRCRAAALRNASIGRVRNALTCLDIPAAAPDAERADRKKR